MVPSWRASAAHDRPDASVDLQKRYSRSTRFRCLRRILRWHGYLPDIQEQGTLTVIEQGEVLSEALAAA